MGQKWIYDPRPGVEKVVTWEEYWKAREKPRTASYYVQDDTMPDTLHPADGRYYSSKSTFRNVTKAHGCEEIGNDRPSESTDRYESTGHGEAVIEALRRHNCDHILRDL